MMRDRSNFEAGKLLSLTGRLIRLNAMRAILALAVLTAGGLAIDLYAEDPVRMGWILGILQFGFQYVMTGELLADLDRRATEAGGIGSFFLVTLLTWLGIMVGLVLLIIPGVILAVRWSMAGPTILAEPVGITGAFNKSWEATKDHFWPIFVVLIATIVPTTIGMIAIFIEPVEARHVPALLVYNIGINIGLILGWHAAVAIYIAAEPQPKRLEEIFA